MKAILISVRPQWVALILNLIKKDEIRKGTAIGKAINKLIEEQGVAPMLIYCCKNKLSLANYLYEDGWGYDAVLNYDYAKSIGCAKEKLNGKVVARFNATVDFLELKMIEGGLYFTTPDRDCFTPNLDLNENAQIDNWQLLRYTGEKLGTQISDIHINDLEIFDKPKELNEFYKVGYLEERYAVESHLADIEGCDGGVNESYVDKLYEELDQEFQLIKAPQSWMYVEEESQ